MTAVLLSSLCIMATAPTSAPPPAPRCVIGGNGLPPSAYFIQTGGDAGWKGGWDGGWRTKCCMRAMIKTQGDCFWFDTRSACLAALNRTLPHCLPCTGDPKQFNGCPEWDCHGSAACKPIRPPGPAPAPPAPPGPPPPPPVPPPPAPPGPSPPPPPPPSWGPQPKVEPPTEIVVKNPKRLPPKLSVLDHTGLGIVGDYKPYITLLKNGDLLIVSGICGSQRGGTSDAAQDCKTMCDGGRCGTTEGGANQTNLPAAMWRSTDQGKTWGDRQLTTDNATGNFLSVGHENALFTTASGAVLLLANPLVYRSTDHGYTWKATTPALPGRGFAGGASAFCPGTTPAESARYGDSDCMGWQAVEVSAGEASQDHFPLAAGVYVFSDDLIHRSTDSGATWALWVNGTNNHNRTQQGLARGTGFFAQSGLYLRKNGDLLHPTRINTNESWDNCAGSQLWLSRDGGRTFSCSSRPVGGYCGNDHTNSSACGQCTALCKAHPASCGDCWAQLPKECLRCGQYTQFITSLCDTPQYPKFLTTGDMYARFTRLRDGRVLLTYSHRVCRKSSRSLCVVFRRSSKKAVAQSG